jgi:outer membrane receptor protein involved in Fe transport
MVQAKTRKPILCRSVAFLETIARKSMNQHRPALCLCTAFLSLLLCSGTAFAQTTGRIMGTVRDQSGAVIADAQVTVTQTATGTVRRATSSEAGIYEAPLLAPGIYRVSVAAPGLRTALFESVTVTITETTPVDAELSVGSVAESVTVTGAPPLVQNEGPQLGRVVDSRSVAELPLATRNFTQILSLSPGAATFLPDSTALGRNTQAISVNGARVTQNNLQINGVDANTMGTNGPILVAVPAPESIGEFKVQTSLYDASYGRGGGGNIQIVTKSGTNQFRGVAYGDLRDDSLNANNPFLKAAGVGRPILRRDVLGGTLGGPLRKETAFFFVSYQGSRERNGASLINSLSSNVPVAVGVTNDRSAQTLSTTFNVPVSNISPAALALLNARLPGGHFAIPTPDPDGTFTASTPSTFREDQFNVNFESHLGPRSSMMLRTFFAHSSMNVALPSFRGTGPNVPGFGSLQSFDNRVLSLQHTYAASATLFNELRMGYVSNPNTTVPQEPIKDSDVGIFRANGAQLPGLPLIRIAPGAGGVIIGTPSTISSAQPVVVTVADTVSLLRAKHALRLGAEARYNLVNIASNPFTRGQVDFQNFPAFLTGTTQVTTFGSGLTGRSQRAWDYNVFVQDDWKISPRLTMNLGVRYELDMPVYETRGLLSTFDPALYRPRSLSVDGVPGGPPAGDLVQAGNVAPSFAVAEVPNVGKYVVKNVDFKDVGPRLGFAYRPWKSERFIVRGGYGLAFSRPTFQYASGAATLPPNFILGVRNGGATLDNPFFPVPAANQFPLLVTPVALAGSAFDRNLRTPYFHQFNVSAQHAIAGNYLLEIAYVGTRGEHLFRQVAINQAQLASPQHPIVNAVTGETITANTGDNVNASLRSPFQGVSITGFTQNQTTAESRYHSLQISLSKRLSFGLQFLVAYTLARSTDNGSGAGGGAGLVGLVNTGAVGDTSGILGNQLDPRANRGPSDFDRTHRLAFSHVWDLPALALAERSRLARTFLSNWTLSGIITAMSGLPIDIVDTQAGSLYGLAGGSTPLARPNPAGGATCESAARNVPAGFYFDPFAFTRPVVAANQPIPSSGGSATAGAIGGTDIGTVPRNCLRGPRQVNVDFAVGKRFAVTESRSGEFRVEFFNLFNQVNYANPISNLNAAAAAAGTGGSINANTGVLIAPGNFGRIISTSNNPRIVQLVLKFRF